MRSPVQSREMAPKHRNTHWSRVASSLRSQALSTPARLFLHCESKNMSAPRS